MATKPTRAERNTAELKERFRAHIRAVWPQENEKFPDQDYCFAVGDGPFQVWSCSLTNQKTAQSDEGQKPNDKQSKTVVWLLWDGSEVSSYEDSNQDQAFVDLINRQRSRRLDSKLKYYTSPLTVSAILAIILFVLIAVLELGSYAVPDQLWSVFTAVVAFYFGKESAHNASVPAAAD